MRCIQMADARVDHYDPPRIAARTVLEAPLILLASVQFSAAFRPL